MAASVKPVAKEGEFKIGRANARGIETKDLLIVTVVMTKIEVVCAAASDKVQPSRPRVYLTAFLTGSICIKDIMLR